MPGQQLPCGVLGVDGVVLACESTFHRPRWAGDLVDLVALIAQVAGQTDAVGAGALDTEPDQATGRADEG